MSALSAALLAFAAWAQAPPESNDVELKLAELDRALPAALGPLAAELAALGEEAALAALSHDAPSFAALPLDARRARAWIAKEVATERVTLAALERLDDPDEEVRRLLLRTALEPRDATALIDERVAACERSATTDASDELRITGVRGLARIDADSAAAALARLAFEGAAEVRTAAARSLVEHARGRGAVLELVQDAAGGRRANAPSEALAILLGEGYGSALAETPEGGLSPQDRTPFELGARHPHPSVRSAALAALDTFVARAGVLGEPARADRVLAALAHGGFDEFEIAARRVLLAAREMSDPEAALARALELEELSVADQPEAQFERRIVALVLQAGAHLALDSRESAELALSRAAELGLRAAALGASAVHELAGAEPREADLPVAEQRHNLFQLCALVEVYRTLAALQGGAAPNSLEVLEPARAADVLLLESLRSAARILGASVSLDDLFSHRIGPRALVFEPARKRGLGAARALELERDLYQAFANVGGGVPGFRPAQGLDPRFASRLTDRVRFQALELCRSARFEAQLDVLDDLVKAARKENGRELGDLNVVKEAENRLQVRKWMHRHETSQGEVVLGQQVRISLAARALADRLREQGRAEESRVLAERLRDDLGAAGRDYFTSAVEFEVWLADAEAALGGALMDVGDGAGAEQRFQAALTRLASLEQESQAEGDERGRAALRWQLSGVLTSLAVNANVKLRDPAAALGYFESAYALRQDDFMRVLLACYRARAGQPDEARAILREVPASPGNFYNLACTHALLGESELALDFLRRDFDELRGSGGARERQKTWARNDPDLASLRDDPRFRALVQPAGEGEAK